MTITISSTQASFDKDFRGLSFTLNLEGKFNEKFSFLLDACLLHNFSVESGFANGQMFFLGVKYPFSGDEQRLYLIYFFNESDTSVASYNSYRIGHNNRDGYGLRLKHDFTKDIYFDFTYLKSEPINAGQKLRMKFLKEKAYTKTVK